MRHPQTRADRRYLAEEQKRKIVKRYQHTVDEYNHRFDEHKQWFFTRSFGYRGATGLFLHSHYHYCDCHYQFEDLTPTGNWVTDYIRQRWYEDHKFLNVRNPHTGAEFHTCEESENFLPGYIGRSVEWYCKCRSCCSNPRRDPQAHWAPWGGLTMQEFKAFVSFEEQMQDVWQGDD